MPIKGAGIRESGVLDRERQPALCLCHYAPSSYSKPQEDGTGVQ